MTTKINGTNTAANPAITGADTDTGLSFGTDTVNINTGGTTRATVDSNGSLGVGTTSPSSFDADGDDFVVSTSGHTGITINSGSAGSTSRGSIYFAEGTAGDADKTRGAVQYQHGDDFMRCITNANERMRIDSSGKLLVGRTNSITITGDGSTHVFEAITDNGYALATHSDTSNKRGIGIYYPSSSGASDAIRFAIGSSAKFIVNGDGNVTNANNSYGSISDVSLKENIVDANSQWDDIKNIRVRNYNFKESTGQPTHTQIGVVAQELETVSPKLVEVSEDGTKTVSYSILYMKAVKALQEAQARIETLEAEKTQMQTDLTALTARVTALEAA